MGNNYNCTELRTSYNPKNIVLTQCDLHIKISNEKEEFKAFLLKVL